MSRRALSGQDDPGDFQAIRSEVVAPFKRLLQAAGSEGAAVPAKQQEQDVQQEVQEQPGRPDEGKARKAGQTARRPLQAVNNAETQAVAATADDRAAGGGGDVRLALASAVYEASYMSGCCLGFPWDLALQELNALKAAAITRRTQQPTSHRLARAPQRPSVGRNDREGV
jgi:hypothetical protein